MTRLAAFSLALAMICSSGFSDEPRKLLLLGQSPDGHPSGTHEYMAGMRVLQKCLAKTPGLKVEVVKADNPWKEGPDLLAKADGAVVFLSQGAKWIHENPRRLEAFNKLAARGGGLSVLHWGMGTKDAEPIQPFLKLFGACHGGPDRKYIVVNDLLQVHAADHPVTRGVENLRLREEFYFKLKRVQDDPRFVPLLKAKIKNQLETVCWAWERPDKGRSFGFTGLHFHANWNQRAYQRVVTQGVLWTMRQDVPEQGVSPAVTSQDVQLKKSK